MKIINGTVYDVEQGFVERTLQIENGVIVAESTDTQVIDAKDLYVIPGLVDIHFHGCMGYDFCDGTKEALAAISTYELSQGVMAICPASMTFSEEKLTEIFENAKGYENPLGADLVGINMEGPFISYEKRGAQNPEFIHKPDAKMFLRLQEASGGMIQLLDIAPEEEGAMECIDYLHDQVRISLAHTMADYETATEAFAQGAKQVTHLYNAMPPFHHREPGVIGAACDQEEIMVELITDNVHSHPSVVRTTFKMFGKERIIFISDSMMATGLEDGQYTLGGQDVTVVGNRATLTKEGNIAGSATNLMNCVRTAVKEMGIPLEDAICCAAYNPAKAIGIEESYGSLEIGQRGNVVLLDKNLDIKYLIKDGKVLL